jgi:hypothetical protein
MLDLHIYDFLSLFSGVSLVLGGLILVKFIRTPGKRLFPDAYEKFKKFGPLLAVLILLGGVVNIIFAFVPPHEKHRHSGR